MLSRLASYLKVTAGVAALLSHSAAWAQQLPTGGSVATGSATIVQPNASTLNINQSTNQAVINWNSFSVGRGGTVNFNQPNSSSATLNRVLGSTPSWIGGTINAPGTVLLVNPNGIAITKSGVVNTGSFAASTLDISNADFMAGNYKFTGNGGSAGVRNAGRINVSDGGFAALLGGQVSNSGIISARLGKVGLGAGELITLDFAGDGFLSVAVPSSQIGKLVNASGALVTNSGKIRADGGQVFLSAATASNILRDAVNVPGSIRANSVGTRGGRIVIGGGAGGKVNVTGKLAAKGGKKNAGGKIELAGASVNLAGKVNVSGKTGGTVVAQADQSLTVSGKIDAKGRDGKGGEISITSADVQLAGAMLDASGATGGGAILIGGGYQGTGSLAHALNVTVDTNSVIRADALQSGDGGTVIVWSDKLTTFAGQISARGGAEGGNGGFAEVSGKEKLAYTGFTDLRAARGRTGALLLDPSDIIIDSGADDTTQSGGTFTGNSNTSHLNVAVLNAALNAADVIVDASGGPAAGSGSITLASGTTISSNAGHALTLNALTDITLNGSINISNSTVSFVSSGGALVQGGGYVEADTVSFNVAGPVTLTGSSNYIFHISGSTSTGSIAIVSDSGLIVGGLTAGPNASVTLKGNSIFVDNAITGQAGVTLDASTSANIIILNANVSAANGNVVLKADGSIRQSNGAISSIGLAATATNSFGVFSPSDIVLTQFNTISTFAANAPSGGVILNVANGFTVGSVGGVNGITARDNVALQADGTIGQTQAISASGLGARTSYGDINLASVVNAARVVAFSSWGNVSYRTLTDLVVGSIGYDGGLSSASGAFAGGALALVTTGATTTLTQSAAITAGTLTVTTNNGSVDLTAANQITNLGTVSTGTAGFNLFDIGGLTVTGAVTARGIGIATTGALAINNTVNAGAGDVSLTATGAGNAISQTVSGIITANTLSLSTTNATLNTATNAVTNLGTVTLGTGALNLVNASGLTVTGAVGATGGITLNTSGALAINNAINAGTGNVSLTTTGAGNGISQNASGIITANTLTLATNNGNAALGSATSAITNLGTVTLGTGALNLLDTGGLTVTGAVGATGGITINTSGALAINNTVNAGAGNVSLTTTGAGNAITQSAGGGITANALALTTANGNATLTAGTNTFASLNALMGTGALAITDTTAGTLTLNIGAAGGVAISNVGNLNGSLSSSSGGAIALTSTAGSIAVGSLFAPGVTVTAANNVSVGAVSTLGAVGAVTLTAAAGSLTFSNIDTLSGSSAGVSLTSASSLVINGYIFANLGTLSLTVTGAGSTISQGNINVAFQGAGLVVNAVNGSVNLTQGLANSFTTVAGRSSGDFAYTNRSGNLAIGTVAGTSGIVSTGGNVTVIASTQFSTGGQLAVNQAVQALSGNVTLQSLRSMAINAALNASTGGSGVISLTTTGAGNAISQNASGVITGNTLSLSTNNGNATLNTATNAVTNLGPVSLGTGAFSLSDAGGLTVTGAITAGAINLTTSGNITVASTISSVAGDITIVADDVDLGTSASVSSAGQVTLRTMSAGRTINLGGAGGTSLGLTSAELNKINAGTLIIGDNTAGNISLTGAIAPTGANTLVLRTGGAITQTAGWLIVQNLALLANSAALSQSSNNVGALAASTSGAISYTDADALTIGSVGGLTGITAGGTVILSAGGSLTVAASINTTNLVDLSAQGPITQASSGAGITVAGLGALRAVTSSGGIALAPTGSGANDVNIISTLAARADSGDITFKAAAGFNVGIIAATNGIIANGAGAAVSLQTTSGAITQSNVILAPTLNVTTAGSDVTLTHASNNVAALGNVSLGAGKFTFSDAAAGGLVVGPVTALGGVTISNSGTITTTVAITANAEIALTSNGGNLTIGGTLTSNGGVIALAANSALTIAAPVLAGNGNIFLAADNMSIAGAGTVQTIGGTINIAPVTAGRVVTLGVAPTPPALVIDNLNVFIGMSAFNVGKTRSGATTAGAIRLGQATFDTAEVNLFTNAGVTQVSPIVFIGAGGIGTLNITAVNTVDLRPGVAMARVTGAISGSGDFVAFSGLSTPTSNLDVGTITTNGGKIDVANPWGTLNVVGALTSNGGDIQASSTGVLTLSTNLASNGGNIVLDSGAALTISTNLVSSGGNILTRSGGALTLNANLNAGAGQIGLVASGGGITQTGGGLIGSNLLAVSGGRILLAFFAPGITNQISGNVILNAGAGGGDITFRNTGGFQLGGFTSIDYSSSVGSLLPAAAAAISTVGIASLVAGGNITQASGAADKVVAGTLVVTGSANPNVTLDNFDNAVANVGTVSIGQGVFTLNNTGNLTITAAAIAGGYAIETIGNLTQNAGANINTSIVGGDISLTACGCASSSTLTLNANLNAGSGAVFLDAGNNLTQQAGTITAANVFLGAGGSLTQPGGGITATTVNVDAATVSLNSSANSFAVIDGVSDGNFSATTSRSLTVGLAGSGSVFSNAGSVSLTALGANSDIGIANVPFGGIVGNNVTLTAGRDILVNGGVGAFQTVSLLAGRNVTESSTGFVFGDSLRAVATAGAVDLSNGNNGVSTIAGSAIGNFRYKQDSDLTIGTVGASSGINSDNGGVTVNAGTGNVTIAALARVIASSDILLAGNSFFNNRGSDAVSTAGRWLIYTDAPGTNTFGGLNSNNTAVWGTTYPAPVAAAGNRYVFATAATALTFTPDTVSKVYGNVTALTYTVTGFMPGVAVAFLSDTAATAFTGTPVLNSPGAAANASVPGGPYAIIIAQGTVAGINGYTTLNFSTGLLTVSPATLIYLADAASRASGTPNPALTGSVTGFVNGETLGSATAGALVFASLADGSSPAGSYAINGSGLDAANYIFVQASGNATALTINQAPTVTPAGPTTPPSLTNPTTPVLPVTGLTIPSAPQPGGITQVSFTPPPIRVASTPATDVAPAALSQGRDLATNNGLTYPPINQFDPNQYAQFKLPDFAAQAGEAAIFAMIARGADSEHAADDLIDVFWNGTSGAWTPPKTAQVDKVTFSDGAGNKVDPTGNGGFPIVPGSIDFGQLLKTAPVMISDGGQPAHWLLATQMTADGKGIVANDPASGKQVVLTYDASTKTVGGVTGVFDANSNKFVSFADASASTPSLTGLQGFAPTNFLAVSTK